ADTAELLDDADAAQSYRILAAQIRTRFNEEFYDGNGEYKNNGSCQTANAMALVTGLCEPENEQAVLDAMVADMKARDYQQTAGDIGFHYLVEALGTYGKNEVLYKNMNRREEGSYGYIVDRGWTALPEAWDANTRVSMNHCMLGHGQQWFYAHVLGIRQADDSVAFRKIVIKPAFETGLEWARGHYDSASGRIRVDWKQNDTELLLALGIPPNTTAMVYVPTDRAAAVTESGNPVSQAEGVKFLRMEKGRAVFAVASGSYTFKSSALKRFRHVHR
ncbi:MAG TPA: alpha-L-rhamnosidase C-terminal domain-containing protein, partial [Opitutales bacterium]|nr:alpha-L-rhamnosidase C-terminal domain-containing protein [Opitutales bacterium]